MKNYEKLWESSLTRDGSYDGRFILGVRTTGIYCKPSCPARRPLRKNVEFYATPAQAERAGLRPCLRCKPLESEELSNRRIRESCEYMLQHLDEKLTLEILAKHAGLSPHHFQRTFKAAMGVSPKKYLDALRRKQLRTSLKSAKDVTQAVYDSGYGSSSPVYKDAGASLGMTPSEYRGRGRGKAITYACVQSPFGLLMLGATDRGLCFVQFGESQDALLAQLREEYSNAAIEPMTQPVPPEFQNCVERLNAHLAGSRHPLVLPLDVRRTAFQMQVWSYLQTIPYGEVRSYSEVASALGKPKAARAVARACAQNVVALAIPCHRVIRGSGELGGYRWGLERKRALLDRERAPSS